MENKYAVSSESRFAYLRMVYADAVGFIVASFLYFFSLILYTWSTPSWFNSFPRASAFRFILAIGVYCLCCILFFGLRFLYAVSDNFPFSFIITFLLSFIPVVVFSVLILIDGGIPLQRLHIVVRIFDICISTEFCFAVYITVKKTSLKKVSYRFLRIWLFYGVFQFTVILFSLLPFLSGFIVALCRISSLFFCLFLSFFKFYIFPAKKNRNIDEIVGKEIASISEQYGLSPRETEVLTLLCSGKTNDEIAAALFISVSTVKTHISSIFMKTGTRNRLETAILCRKN